MNYFTNSCTNVESINKGLILSSTIYFSVNPNDNKTIILNTTFDLVTISNYFDLRKIHPIRIIETSLYKTLVGSPNFYIKPKTGYCAQYKNDDIVLLMDTETKANKLPFIGM